MMSNTIKTYAAISVMIFGFIGVFFLSHYLDSKRPPAPESYIDEDLSLQGEKLKGYSLGFEGMIADWYWMRSLQYIGYKLVNSKNASLNLEDLNSLNPKLLYPLLDNATTLDPRFMAAYSYGAVVLPAIDPEQAIKIIEKGIRNNPKEWRLYQYLGFTYWKLEDYEKAADTYTAGSKIEGSPSWMKSMAAKMTSEGGERETARVIYQELYNDAEDSQTKESARLRLLELDSLEERDAINLALEQFEKQTGSCPSNLKAILDSLKNIRLPNGKDFRLDNKGNLVDPSDAPYRLDPSDCTAKLDLRFTKIPVR